MKKSIIVKHFSSSHKDINTESECEEGPAPEITKSPTIRASKLCIEHEPVDKKRRLEKNMGDKSDSEIKKKQSEITENKTKYDEIVKEMLARDITINDVLKLDLPMDENVWFFEHFKILKSQDYGTEDNYKTRNLIYKRYKNLKNTNIKQLKKIKDESKIDDDAIQRILDSSHPESVKILLYKKYKRCYDNVENGNSDELFKVTEWIDTVLSIPTSIGKEELKNVDEILMRLWNELNKRISGRIKIKEEILEAMCTILLDPDNKGKVILFEGPPGVGKTALAVSIAEALVKPFDQISFGSIKDSSALTGHSPTYIASIPGLFVRILTKSGRLDTVVLLDELDKIPDTPEGRSITSVLLHALDRTQNHRFRDMHSPEITIDLSKMIFVGAANELQDIDPVLLDRMIPIKLHGYTIEEKVDIALQHMFPKIRKELNFRPDELLFKKQEMEYFIKNKTNDQPGVRDVEKQLYKICEKLALLKYAKGIPLSYKITNIKFPYIIDNCTINKLM